MVVYGFLNYSKGYISIPNKELMDKFAEVIQREPSLGNVYKLAKESGRMLAATKAGDTKTMAELLEYAHNTHSPLTLYNNEAELASIIRWVYLKALDFYRIEREDKAGIGYVDFIFYPFQKNDDAIIIELKVNHSAAVSYTHLDVYKRQHLAEDKVHGKFRAFPFQKSAVHFHISIGVSWKSRCRHIPVSYTHLDHILILRVQKPMALC